jgi:alkylation response protein AidB-like acyl-CoA dehydrogenase
MEKPGKRFTGGGLFLVTENDPQEIFTPEDFTKEHVAIERAIKDFIKGEISSRGDEIETLNNQLSRELMRKIGELGFLAIDIPEKYGGMELDKISASIISENLGYGAGSFTVTELNHTGIGTLPLVLFGTEEQKKKYLPLLGSGNYIGAFGLTEPEAGSDALNSLATATISANGQYYLLNGNKQFITNAAFADTVFTYAKVDAKFFTAFIVEQNWEGVSVGEEEEKMGVHGTSTRAYHFDNVKVPIENVLGEVGKGHVVALNALNMGRFRVGASCLGSAKRAFFEAVQYAKQRVQFGRSICEFGLIKEKIAKMAIRLFATESMVYRTSGLIQSELKDLDMNSNEAGIKIARALEDYLIECSINKVYGTETEDYVVDEEVQIFGGYGYIRGNHPEQAYRNARINRIWEGTNEINRLTIVNTLIRRIAKGTFDLMQDNKMIVEEIEKFKPIGSDEPDNLNAQKVLIQIAKKFVLLILGTGIDEYGKNLREEQELIGMLSDMIIEIYAAESTLLRSLKILHSKNADRASIPVKMTKVLFHDSIEKMSSLTRRALGSLENEDLFKKYLTFVQSHLVVPPSNIVILQRNIADALVRRGRYRI